jgi:hypothetical protein
MLVRSPLYLQSFSLFGLKCFNSNYHPYHPFWGFMTPPWPFKKKAAPQEETAQPVAYDRDQDGSAATLNDKSHVENQDFKAAMAALSTPHLETSSGEQKVPTNAEYVQSGDGYWYLKKADGSYDPTPYVKSEDGSFSPYSA